ncbi:MAG: hypothetical protein RL701_1621 [Pseudomonadota bacterium]
MQDRAGTIQRSWPAKRVESSHQTRTVQLSARSPWGALHDVVDECLYALGDAASGCGVS